MSSVKKAASNNRREARKTGGGPPPEELTSLEDKVVGIIGETPIEGIEGGTDTGSVTSGDGSETDVLDFTLSTCPNSRKSSNSSMENDKFLYNKCEPSCSFWTESTKDSCMTGEAPIAKSTMQSNKTLDMLEDKTTQSLIAIEERRLKTEEERLCAEKQRLTMESERLDIERHRFNVEQQKHQLYLAQMNINLAQMGVQVLDQQTLNTPGDA